MSKLILVRHGKSQYNLENRFTGWLDVPLVEQGIEEAHNAGKTIKETKLEIDACFCSKLQRAKKTQEIIFSELGIDLNVVEDEALNERHYGELQGKNKAETAEKFGAEQVHIWRRSYDVPPPGGESLKDTAARTLPYFNSKILPLVEDNKTVLVVAHGNSLRSIVMEIESLSPEEILKREIPTGTPIFYSYEEGRFKIIDS